MRWWFVGVQASLNLLLVWLVVSLLGGSLADSLTDPYLKARFFRAKVPDPAVVFIRRRLQRFPQFICSFKRSLVKRAFFLKGRSGKVPRRSRGTYF